jgi:hypothetical protein
MTLSYQVQKLLRFVPYGGWWMWLDDMHRAIEPNLGSRVMAPRERANLALPVVTPELKIASLQ